MKLYIFFIFFIFIMPSYAMEDEIEIKDNQYISHTVDENGNIISSSVKKHKINIAFTGKVSLEETHKIASISDRVLNEQFGIPLPKEVGTRTAESIFNPNLEVKLKQNKHIINIFGIFNTKEDKFNTKESGVNYMYRMLNYNPIMLYIGFERKTEETKKIKSNFAILQLKQQSFLFAKNINLQVKFQINDEGERNKTYTAYSFLNFTPIKAKEDGFIFLKAESKSNNQIVLQNPSIYDALTLNNTYKASAGVGVKKKEKVFFIEYTFEESKYKGYQKQSITFGVEYKLKPFSL